MIPLGLKETTECDLAVPIKASTCTYLYLHNWYVHNFKTCYEHTALEWFLQLDMAEL